MNVRNSLMGLGVAAIAISSPLAAQEGPRWDAGLSLVMPLDALTSLTNNHGLGGGFIPEIGFNGKLVGTTVPFRVTFGINDLPGKDNDGTKTSLMGYQLAGDLFTDTGWNKLSLVTGLSINRWQMKVDSTTSTVKGIKLGGRIGLEYRMSKACSADLLLQAVELGTDPQGITAYNPSWLQVGVKYHW